jgi:hypothetical protein
MQPTASQSAVQILSQIHSQTSSHSTLQIPSQIASQTPSQIASQPTVQSTPQSTGQTTPQVTAQPEFDIVRPRNSNELHRAKSRIRGWYIGLLRHLPPPEDVSQKWESILPILVEQLRVTTAKLDRKISTAKSTTEPVLCMAGKECNSAHASKFLPTGVDCPPDPVLLKPTVWIYCGGSKCKARIKEEIRPNEPPLCNFLQSFHSPVGFHISKQAPRPASGISSPESSDSFTQANEISFAVRYPLSPDKPWPATARFTVGSTHLYSTIGGPIHVKGKCFGLTTAHGIINYLDQISKESPDEESSDEDSSDKDSLASDADSEMPSSSTFKKVYEDMEVEGPSGSHDNMEVDRLSASRWEVSELPRILAYLGRGTSTGDYLFREHASTTSDFALVDSQSHRHQAQPIANIFSSKDALFSGEVCINPTAAGPPLNGYLLKSKSFLILRGIVIKTMKIQIESPARALPLLVFRHQC